MKSNQINPKLQVKHLIYMGIFLITLGFRLYAAGHLAITQPEADILLNLTQSGGAAGSRGSLLYQLLTLPLIAVFGSGRLIVRFWLILAGALLTLVPLLFEDRLGERPALILSALLALDPFGSAASLQLNSGLLSLATLTAAMGLLHRKKYLAGIIALLAFVLSGRMLLYPLGVGLMVLLVLSLQKELAVIRQYFLEVWEAAKANIRTVLAVVVGLVLLTFILRVPLSDGLNDIFAMFANWGQPYALGSSPQLYPIALFSYVPLGLLCLVFPARTKTSRNFFPYLYLVSILALILITVNPGHQVLDLVWVSSPLWIAGAFNLCSMLDQIKTYSSRVKIYTLIIICLLVSLSMTFVMIAYQFRYGLDLVGNLLSAISLLVMVTMVVLFLAYNDSVSMALTALKWSLVIVMAVFQLAFTWRAMGLTGKPAGEILWGGYFEGVETVEQMVQNTALTRTDTNLDMSVGILQPANSAVTWELARQFPLKELTGVTTDQHLAVLITQNRDGLSGVSADGYYGQDFNANSYPFWIWQPGKNLMDTDYWFWLFFRKGEMMRETNFIWVNKTLFENSY